MNAGILDKEAREKFTFPAQYMFKDVPDYGDVDEPVELLLAEMDRFNVARGMLNVSTNPIAREAVRTSTRTGSSRASTSTRTRDGGVRKLDAAVRELDVRSAQVFPAGLLPQVPINDKKMYPLYAKCVELDIPIFVNAGVPGPRVPMACQDVAHIDEVCWFFPELKLVMRHGAEPWTALAVKLMLKWPNLYYSTSAFAPKHYPDDVVYFANTRGADKVLYAGYFPMGLSLERIFSELPSVGFRDHVWPKFLRENATRLLKLEADLMSREAYEAAHAGGVIDTATGIPKSREEMYKFYEFIRNQTRDAESKAGEGGLEFPAGYMFKDPVHIEADELGDPVEFLLARDGPPRHHQGDHQRRRRRQRCTRRPRSPGPLRRRHRRRPEPGHGGGAPDPADRRRVRPQVRERVPRRACTPRSR